MTYTAPRPPGLKNLGLPWTPQDLGQLENLVKSGMPAARIARLLERSTVAIRAKAGSQGWHLRRISGHRG